MADFSRFVSQHKTALLATAVVGTAAIAGTAYYLSQQQQFTPPPTPKKKNKNKKKKKRSTSSQTESKSSPYPVNDQGLPDLTEEIVNALPEEEKDKWALSLKESGNEYFKKKDFDTAIVYYSSALQCKIDPVFYANRSACYAALNKDDQVIEDTSEALKINPAYTKCLLRRAHAYENLEKYPEAMFDLTALTIHGGMNDHTNEAMLERVLRKHSTKINEEEYANLPKELPSSSSMSSFFGAFSPVDIDLDESSYSANSGAQFLVKGLNKVDLDTTDAYDEADVLFNQAISKFKADPEADPKLFALALEYKGAFDFLKTDSESGVEALNKSLQVLPRPRAHVILGLIRADKGDANGANEEFESAVKLNSEDPDIYYHFGQMFYLVGDLASAQTNFEKAKVLNPSNVYAYIQLACIAYRQGDSDSCDKLFKEAKLKFPTSPEVPNYYGEILFDRQNFQSAEKQFDTAARLQEALPTFNIGCLPLINKSAIYQREGNVDKCVETLSRACELDSKSDVARSTLGQIYLQLQKVDEAIKLFEEACKLSRSPEERTQCISLMEASKMQLKIKEDPILSAKVDEIIRQAQMQAGGFP